MVNFSEGTTERAVKTVIYGVEGIGKSTFASHFPAPIFFDLDNGTARLNVKRATGFSRWEELLQAVESFPKAPWSKGFKTLVIDTADAAARLCESYVIKTYGKGATSIESFPYGKGYKILAEEFSRLLVDFEVLIDSNINVVVVAHAMQRTVTLPEAMGSYDHWEFKLPGTSVNKLGPLIKEWSDLLIFANFKTTIVEDGNKKKAVGGKRVMYLGHTSFADAKNRFNIEGTKPFDYAEIAPFIPSGLEREDALEKAKAEMQALEKKAIREPLKRDTGLPKGLIDQVKALMAKGLSNDPAPITEKELNAALSGALGKPATLADFDASSVETLVKNWDNVRLFIQNNVRTPF